MSTTSVYFIPEKKYSVGQFKVTVKKSLEALKIIDGYYDKEDELYASAGVISFEYASIHDTNKNKLVPEASSAGYGAICPNCEKDIDEELYDIINDYYEYEEETGKENDMIHLSVVCPNCNTSATFGKIVFTEQAQLTNQFFQFVDLHSNISPELLKKIESAIGSELKMIYERM